MNNRENDENVQAIDEAKDLYQRYAAHGRIDGSRSIVVFTGKDITGDSPQALGFDNGSKNGICALVGITSDYKKAFSGLGLDNEVNSKEFKGFIMAHEDMHCRIDTTNVSAVADGKIDTANMPMMYRFDGLVNESVADSMGVLISARRDGVEASNALLDKLQLFRQFADKDRLHDTRETLNILRDDLAHPERYNSDEAAFKTAISTGLKGAVATFPNQLTDDEKAVLKSKDFSNFIDSQSARFDKSIEAYKNGESTAFPERIVTLRNDAEKRYTAEDFGFVKGGMAAPGQQTPERFSEQLKAIYGELGSGTDNTLDPVKNPYARGREMEAPIQAPGALLKISDRPSAMRM
jgi:hypothetical protein